MGHGCWRHGSGSGRCSGHEFRLGQSYHARVCLQDGDQREKLAGAAHTGHHRADGRRQHSGDPGSVVGEEAAERHQLLPEVAGCGRHAGWNPGHAHLPHQHPIRLRLASPQRPLPHLDLPGRAVLHRLHHAPLRHLPGSLRGHPQPHRTQPLQLQDQSHDEDRRRLDHIHRRVNAYSSHRAPQRRQGLRQRQLRAERGALHAGRFLCGLLHPAGHHGGDVLPDHTGAPEAGHRLPVRSQDVLPAALKRTSNIQLAAAPAGRLPAPPGQHARPARLARAEAPVPPEQAEHAELPAGHRDRPPAGRLGPGQPQHHPRLRGGVPAQLAGGGGGPERRLGLPRATRDDAGHQKREASLKGPGNRLFPLPHHVVPLLHHQRHLRAVPRLLQRVAAARPPQRLRVGGLHLLGGQPAGLHALQQDLQEGLLQLHPVPLPGGRRRGRTGLPDPPGGAAVPLARRHPAPARRPREGRGGPQQQLPQRGPGGQRAAGGGPGGHHRRRGDADRRGAGLAEPDRVPRLRRRAGQGADPGQPRPHRTHQQRVSTLGSRPLDGRGLRVGHRLRTCSLWVWEGMGGGCIEGPRLHGEMHKSCPFGRKGLPGSLASILGKTRVSDVFDSTFVHRNDVFF
ncbi:5-hydroxytryptamine (serotonin) receptor 2C, G protein-coupled-like 1 isoform 1-T3 [Menidia menidia]